MISCRILPGYPAEDHTHPTPSLRYIVSLEAWVRGFDGYGEGVRRQQPVNRFLLVCRTVPSRQEMESFARPHGGSAPFMNGLLP